MTQHKNLIQKTHEKKHKVTRMISYKIHEKINLNNNNKNNQQDTQQWRNEARIKSYRLLNHEIKFKRNEKNSLKIKMWEKLNGMRWKISQGMDINPRFLMEFIIKF